MNKFVNVVILFSACFFANRISAQDLRLFPKYDSIMHYHLEFSEREIYESTKQELDQKFASYGGYLVTAGLRNTIPTDFDSLFSHYGFTKKTLNEKQCKLIDSSFVQKAEPNEVLFSEFLTPNPYFRDYFVFVEDGKAIGIIQIASDQSRFELIGNFIDPKGFGMNFEIGKFMSAYRKTF